MYLIYWNPVVNEFNTNKGRVLIYIIELNTFTYCNVYMSWGAGDFALAIIDTSKLNRQFLMVL